MAQLSRYFQKLFASSATGSRIAMFGSLKAGSPTAFDGATVTPDNIQALSAFDTGLDGAVIGNASPAIQDDNSLHYLAMYQLAYLFQQGVPEYQGSTQYYSNSIVMGSNGILYQATGSTIGVSPPGSGWSVLIATTAPTPTVQTFATGSHTYTKPAGVTYIDIEVVGGGGGGGGGGVDPGGDGGGGNAGSASSFGTLSCIGGNGGTGGTASTLAYAAGGVGGAASAANIFSTEGAKGGDGNGVEVTAATMGGGLGGPSPLGGFNLSATPNGAGGQGGAATRGAATRIASGGGGGAGGYLKAQITTPSSTYSVVVGAGGAGGSAGGTGPNAGSTGMAGIVIVREYYGIV